MEKLSLEYWGTVLLRLSEVFGREEDALCRLDGAIGDGDHGTAMALGFNAAAKRLAAEPPSDVGALVTMTGTAFVSMVGGVTGIIFGTMFIDAAKAAAGKEEIDTSELAAMFDSALEGVTLRGEVKEGNKSMVDALAPVVKALKEAAAKVGRARYQKDKGIGYVDAGATSVALVFRTLAETADG